MILNLFLITFSIVYIIQHSGIVLDVSKYLYQHFNKKEWNFQIIKKPWSCYNCMTFWITLIYLLLSSQTIILSFALASLFGGFISVLIDKLIYFILKNINKIK